MNKIVLALVIGLTLAACTTLVNGPVLPTCDNVVAEHKAYMAAVTLCANTSLNCQIGVADIRHLQLLEANTKTYCLTPVAQDTPK